LPIKASTSLHDQDSTMKAVEEPDTTADGEGLRTFWTETPQAVCAVLHCGTDGLSSEEAERRLIQYGPNSDTKAKADSPLRAILRRLLEPLSLILLAAGIVSVVTGDDIGGSIIVAILGLSIGLNTIQEKGLVS
jgi:Mg2+-importing ATPase